MTEADHAARPAASTQAGLRTLAGELLGTWRELAGVRLAILIEESRATLRSAEWLLVGAVCAALLLAWTWLLALGLLVVTLVRQGLGWEAALGLLLVLNLAAMVVLYFCLRRGLAALGWPHTVAALSGQAPPAPGSAER